MTEYNHTTSPIEANLKFEKGGEEEKVDATLFKKIVGSLRYIWNNRLDIGFLVGLLSKYMTDLIISHMKYTRILIYLSGIVNYVIFFPTSSDDNDEVVTCYSNLDWCRHKSDRRGTTGYFFMVYSAPISWCYGKYPFVALSSCEA